MNWWTMALPSTCIFTTADLHRSEHHTGKAGCRAFHTAVSVSAPRLENRNCAADPHFISVFDGKADDVWQSSQRDGFTVFNQDRQCFFVILRLICRQFILHCKRDYVTLEATFGA